MPPRKKNKHHQLTVEEKLQIIDRINNGTARKIICQEYNISKPTLSIFLKNREKFLLSCNENFVVVSRKGSLNKLYLEMLKWAKEVNGINDFKLSKSVVKTKALELATQFDLSSFKASNYWTSKTFRRIEAELYEDQPPENVDNSTSFGNDFINSISNLVEMYTQENIFFAQEIGLFYCLLPDNVLNYMGTTCSKGERANDRITVLASCNMSGNEKLRLLVIGKSKFPKTKPSKNLPAIYENRNNCWMSKAIFKKWLKNLDDKMHENNRKILLFVGDEFVHISPKNLKAVQMEFAPRYILSELQSVLTDLKKRYRQRLLEHTLLNIEFKKPKDVTLLRSLYILASVWGDVKKDLIQNAFIRAGFQLSDEIIEPEETNVEEDIEEKQKEHEKLFRALREKGMEISSSVNFDYYSEVDASLVCCSSSNTDTLKANVDTLSSDKQAESDGFSEYEKFQEQSSDNGISMCLNESENQTCIRENLPIAYPVELSVNIEQLNINEVSSNDPEQTFDHQSPCTVQKGKRKPAKEKSPIRKRTRESAPRSCKINESSISPQLSENVLAVSPARVQNVLAVSPARVQNVTVVTPPHIQNALVVSPSRVQNALVVSPCRVPNALLVSPPRVQNSLVVSPPRVQRFPQMPQIIPESSNTYIDQDDLVTIKSSPHPMANHHYIIQPKICLLNLFTIDDTFLPLIKHMEEKAKSLSKSRDTKLIVGFHAVPSILPLTMHAISGDFESDFMNSKEIYNSFTTQYFLSCEDVVEQLQGKSCVESLSLAQAKEFLSTPLMCHVCEIPQVSLAKLKCHLQTIHSKDFLKQNV